MRMRYHAQRQHIIHSLNSLLFQLHALSFFLAPSLLGYLCRCGAQLQFVKPREADKTRSLRFWFILILIVNVGSVWVHATTGAPEGKAILLDFVGMGRTPSKLQLLSLDFTILLLEVVLVTLSFETSLTNAMSDDTPDPLYTSPYTETIFDAGEDEPTLPTTNIPVMSTPENSEYTPLRTDEPSYAYPPKQPLPDDDPHLPPREPVMTLTLTHLHHRLTNPTPVPPPQSVDYDEMENSVRRLGLLRSDSAGARTVSRMLNIIGRARTLQRQREREQVEGEGNATAASSSGETSSSTGRRESSPTRIPGAIVNDDEGE